MLELVDLAQKLVIAINLTLLPSNTFAANASTLNLKAYILK